jgi:hypothetical protein
MSKKVFIKFYSTFEGINLVGNDLKSNSKSVNGRIKKVNGRN